MTRTIAIAQNKGGNGKTCTAVNLAAAVKALNSDPVLLVDIDPQANATLHVGIEPTDLSVTVYEAIMGSARSSDVIVKTANGVDVLPSNIHLAGATVELNRHRDGDNRLASVLEQTGNQYKTIIIDTPPSLGLLTVNALRAAGEVIVPVQAEYFALHGLGQMLNALDELKGTGHRLKLAGVLPTMYDQRRNLCKEVVQQMRAELGSKVFQTTIRDNVALAEAPIRGQDIFAYAPNSHGAEDYRALIKELFA